MPLPHTAEPTNTTKWNVNGMEDLRKQTQTSFQSINQHPAGTSPKHHMWSLGPKDWHEYKSISSRRSKGRAHIKESGPTQDPIMWTSSPSRIVAAVDVWHMHARTPPSDRSPLTNFHTCLRLKPRIYFLPTRATLLRLNSWDLLSSCRVFDNHLTRCYSV